MKNTFGQSLGVTIFGESHGQAIGAVLDGLAPGIGVDEAFIARQLDRRRGLSSVSTKRREKDEFRIVSGYFEGKPPVRRFALSSKTRTPEVKTIH